MAYSKQLLKQQLIEELSKLDESLFYQELLNYFPAQLWDQYTEGIKQHCLAQEIVVNSLVNSFVNRMGMVLAFRLMDESGGSIVSVFNVYKQVCHIFAIEDLWQEIEQQDMHLHGPVLERLQQDIRKLISRAMHWFLSQSQSQFAPELYVKGIASLKGMLSSFMSEAGNQNIDEQVDSLIKLGVPASLSINIVSLDTLYLCLDVIWLNQQTECSLKESAQVFFQLMVELDLLWLRDKICLLPEKTVWESLARKTASEEFNAVCCSLTLTVLAQEIAGGPEKISCWLEVSDVSIARYRKLLSLVHTDNEVELEKIMVLLKELRDIPNG